MKLKSFLIILLLLPIFSFTAAHKYYVSLTQVDYNENSKSLQITMNVFIDDMELALNDTYKKLFNLYTEKELPDSETYFQDYLEKHFRVKINGKPATFAYIGRKYEADVVFFYVEVEKIKAINSIEIENTVLFEHFQEQKNLIKFKVNGKFDSALLTQDHKRELLKF
ncbi:MAG TPA: DUF6702 family protein [Flavobacteriaceae bacterium]|nr:DUF6702 family protein [Flavobacteriaceae bacterium]